VVSRTTFAACEDVVRVVGHAMAAITMIEFHRVLSISFIFRVACNRVFELDSGRHLALVRQVRMINNAFRLVCPNEHAHEQLESDFRRVDCSLSQTFQIACFG